LDATSPLTEQRHTALKHGSEGRDYLIRTIVFEASGETEIGKAAVAHVILNRKGTADGVTGFRTWSRTLGNLSRG
jgi:hypothetical protein